MKRALILFNKGAVSPQDEDVTLTQAAALLHAITGEPWLVRTGYMDGCMRIAMIGGDPNAPWGSFFNRWVNEVFEPDAEGYRYSAVICGQLDGELQKTNAEIFHKAWMEMRYSLPGFKCWRYAHTANGPDLLEVANFIFMPQRRFADIWGKVTA